METMYFVKNVSNDQQAIVGIEMFQPQEVREVSEEVKNRLLRNPNFVEVDGEENPTLEEVGKTEKTSTRTPKTK